MDTIVLATSWILLVFLAVSVIGGLFLIGRPKDDSSEHTAGGYLAKLLGSALQLVVVGRCLGWW